MQQQARRRRHRRRGARIARQARLRGRHARTSVRSCANAPTAANIRRYAEIVRERAVLRRLAAAGDEIADSALQPARAKTCEQCSTRPKPKIFQIAESGARGQQGFIEIQPAADAAWSSASSMLYSRDNPSDVTGVANGLRRSRSHDLGPAGRRSRSSSPAGRAWARRRSP